MLQFFRRHQRYFFFIITVVIVISFSFFGTYSTLDRPHPGDRVVFQSVDGQNIRHSDVEELALFIGSDEGDKMAWGGEWGPNFLNDGVVAKDFLGTGLAKQLVQAYRLNLAPELQQRLEREQRHRFYVHPAAPYISSEVIWGYFAPQIPAAIAVLRSGGDAADAKVFDARANLYLAEKEFPARSLRQVLRFQEQQYNWLTPDPSLDRSDLSMFGYHNLEDWFGPKFVRLVSQFIINAAKIAERKGYQVTREEAMADLIRQAEVSYAKWQHLPRIGVTSAEQYLRMQLRRMGLDESRAAAVWRQVLLFRRLFHGVGDAVFVDALPFNELNQYALEKAEGQLYQLPEGAWLPNFRALQKFQVYLDAVAKSQWESPLALPSQYATAEELLKKHPELVQRVYLLEVAEASAKALQGRVAIKDMWDWQVQDAHWNQLKADFPELGLSKAKTSTERFNALEALDATTRSRVDAVARAAIVAEHPDWLQQALDDADPQEVTVGVRVKGGQLPFAGVTDREALIALLDQAPMGGEAFGAGLEEYSGDGQSYYRIKVLDRRKDWEVLTYAEAARDETLDQMVTALLAPYYAKIRESQPDDFRKSDGSWRALHEVQDQVAESYFKDLLTALARDDSQQNQGAEVPNRNALAPYRLVSYMRSVKDRLLKSPASESDWLRVPDGGGMTEVDKLPPTQSLADQFKLTKRAHAISRSDLLPAKDKESLFASPLNGWTPIFARPNGDVWFFQVTAKGLGDVAAATAQQVAAVRDVLADDAQQLLMRSVLKELKDKRAIDLSNADRRIEEEESLTSKKT